MTASAGSGGDRGAGAGRGTGAGRVTGNGGRIPGGDPEVVLSQALRAIAGGGRKSEGIESAAGAGGSADAVSPSWWSRLTTIQIVLLALIVGLSAGMIAGIVVLLFR